MVSSVISRAHVVMNQQLSSRDYPEREACILSEGLSSYRFHLRATDELKTQRLVTIKYIINYESSRNIHTELKSALFLHSMK